MATVYLDGSDRIRHFSDVGILNNEDYTVMFWAYPEALHSGTTLRYVLGTNACIFDSNATNTIRLRKSGTAVFDNLTDSSALALNTPVHIAMRIRDATDVDLFTDGVEVDSDSDGTIDTEDDSGFHIGETSNGFIGQMGDFRIYNRRLGSAEIRTIATCHGTDGITRDMLLRWSFFEVPRGDTVTGDIIINLATGSNDSGLSGTAPVGGDDDIGLGYRRRCA